MHGLPGRPARFAVIPFALLLAARPAHASPRAASPAAAPAPVVIGEVRDTAGVALPNVRVVVAELARVTTTNEAGRFTIAGIPAGSYHLNFLLLGYTAQHVAIDVPAEGDTVRVAVVMRRSTVRLQTVQVTATPTGTDPLNITQATVELSGKELARNLGASVAQTLSAEPGMSQRFNGPVANAPVIRGLTGERIVVLHDGERAADLSSVSADHAVTVDPLSAQRVEVVRGPASLLYGNNALGGVVNVISNDIPTSVPTHVEGFVGAQAESATPGGALTGSVTARVGSRGAVGIRGSWRDMDDLRTGGGVRLGNTAARNWSAVVGAGLVAGDVTAGVAYRGYDFRYGVPARPGAEESGIRIDGRRHQVTGRGTFSLGVAAMSSVKIDGTAQWYSHDEIEPSGDVGTTFTLRTQTLNATARTQLGRLAGALGVQGLFRQYAPVGEEALTPSAITSNGGVFVYQEYPLGSGSSESRTPRLQFGGRYDLYRLESQDSDDAAFGPGRSRSFRNVSGSLGVSVPFGRVMSLSGSIARAFRAPTVEELFSNAYHAAVGTFDVGTPTLRAERNRGADVVLRAQSGRTFAQLAAFVNRVDDFIAPEVDPANPTAMIEEEAGSVDTVPRVRFAQQRATLRGFEGQVEWALARRWVVGAMGDVVRGRFDVASAPLPFMPPARVGASVRWDDGRLFVSTDVRRALAQRRVTQPDCGPPGASADDASCVDVPTPAYTLLNASAGLTLVRGILVHSLTLRADNALDARWFDATSRIKAFSANAGRNVSLVYRVLF